MLMIETNWKENNLGKMMRVLEITSMMMIAFGQTKRIIPSVTSGLPASKLIEVSFM
jgi:hypothetical protein